MASPYTLLMTEDQEIAYDAGLIDGRDAERKRILESVEKMKPYIDDKGVQWIPHYPAIILAIKGENK